MTDTSQASQPAAVDTVQPARPLHDCVAFMARFLGTPVQLERLRETLAAVGTAGASDSLAEVLQHAGLTGTPLAADKPRRATELPALLLAADGPAVAVLALKDGRYECHLPGIEGSSWLDAEALAAEVPAGRWVAVRPAMHFDQRSLLYTLPTGGHWFWATFNRNRWIFRWALLGTLALNIFGALVPFYTMAVYDRVIPNNALNSLWVLTVAVGIIIGFELVMRVLRSHLLESAARRMDVTMSTEIFAHTLKLRAASRPASGGVLANTVRDFEAVREFFATGTLAVLGDLPFVLLFLAVIALVAGPLVAVPLVAIPLLLLVAWVARAPLARRVAEGLRESSQRTAHLFETMNGLDTVKALGAEAWSRRRWEGLTQAIAGNSQDTREIVARVNYINMAILGATTVAVVGFGAILAGQGALSLGQLIAASLLTGRALQPVSQIAGLIVRWQQTKLSYEALNKVMSAPTDDAPTVIQAPPLTGALEFRDVSFAYGDNPPAVERISLRIAPGERVGIIGKLGSGKSTLLRLILNQYEPTAGSVLADDLVTTQLDALSLRRQIGYVPQDVTLFHGSIRENIELGRTQSDDQALVDAMRLSGLDDVVAQLPAGVGTEVGERGERLSGGQRQTVAIARAVLGRPRLVLLDEPSSMIDPGSEQRLIARLRAMPNATIVLVTHRMAMLALVDRLLVMDKGRIVADGPRDEVLAALAQRGAADGGSGAAAGTAPGTSAADAAADTRAPGLFTPAAARAAALRTATPPLSRQ
jgi:ATP-binding cassette subfamily C protein LapB